MSTFEVLVKVGSSWRESEQSQGVGPGERRNRVGALPAKFSDGLYDITQKSRLVRRRASRSGGLIGRIRLHEQSRILDALGGGTNPSRPWIRDHATEADIVPCPGPSLCRFRGTGEAMKHARWRTVLRQEAEKIVVGAYTVQNQWKPRTTCKLDLGDEHPLLPLARDR